MTPRGVRNNNFGNIEDGPFARSLPGYAGSDGRFARFTTPDDGINAQSALLEKYGQRGINTVQGVVNRWAPPSDGNDTSAYSGYVSKRLGIAPTDTLDMNDPTKRAALARAMAEHENGPQALASAMSLAPTQASASTGNTAMAGPPGIGAPFALFGPEAGAPEDQGYDRVSRGLAGIGASLMAIDNPKGAAVLAAQAKKDDGSFQMHFDPTTGQMFRINKETGAVSAAKTQNGMRMNEGALKHISDASEKFSTIHSLNQQAADLRDDLETGKLDLGAWKNWVNSGRNYAGISNDQSLAYRKYDAFVNQLANDQMLMAKGVQTEGDAYRAMKQFATAGANYDNNAAKAALDDLMTKNRKAVVDRGGAQLDAYRGMYGADNAALAPFGKQLDEQRQFYTERDRIAAERKAAREQQQTQQQPQRPRFKVLGVE